MEKMEKFAAALDQFEEIENFLESVVSLKKETLESVSVVKEMAIYTYNNQYEIDRLKRKTNQMLSVVQEYEEKSYAIDKLYKKAKWEEEKWIKKMSSSLTELRAELTRLNFEV